MNPDLIREMLAVINEVSQPIYMAARQKVLIYNWGTIAVFVPLLLASLVGIVVGWRKADADPNDAYAYLALFCIAACLMFLTAVIVSVMRLLTLDYQVYLAIRVMLLGD